MKMCKMHWTPTVWKQTRSNAQAKLIMVPAFINAILTSDNTFFSLRALFIAASKLLGPNLIAFFLSLFCTEAAENHFCLDRHLSFVFLSLSCALSLLFKLAPFAIRHVLALASCPISFYIWRTILDPRNGRYKSRMLHWPSVVKPFRNENRSSSRFDSGTNLKIRYWDFIFRGRTKLLLRTMIETVQIASL